MIRCLANVDESGYDPAYLGYTHGTFEELQQFLLLLPEYQLDVETNVVDSIVEQRLRTIQFGEYNPSNSNKIQWVVEWTILNKEQKIWLLTYINDKKRKKHIFNAAFEYQMFLNYGLVMENVWDAMLNEKIIYTGYGSMLDEDGATFFSLEGVARRRLGIELDKTYQLLFGFEHVLTPGHIHYAAQDVQHLDVISAQQDEKLEEQYGDIPKEERTVFNHLPTLENEAVLAFGDIMWNGLKVDQEMWAKNASEAQPIVDKYKAALEQYLIDDPALNAKAIELGYINLEDSVEMNWNSPPQKREILSFAFPDIPGATQPIIKKYLKDQVKADPDFANTAAYSVLSELATGNHQPFFDMLVKHCKEDLIKMEYLIPAGTIRINWGSWQQVLPLFQAVKKTLKDTKEESMNKLGHPVGFALLDYRGAKMLTTTYGVDFLQKLDSDGKVRTRFNQILETGRVSSSDPNMQQIPANDDVGNRYRNCFMADSEDEVFVDSDYSSQELVIIASLSQDPVWMAALKVGHDLHSICAQLVHGKEWDSLALDTCDFKLHRQKCKCPGHKRLRNGIKTINFGLAYGMSQFKLAATLKISVKEAEALIEKYFRTFPKIGGKLTALGRFALRNGYIMTLAPYKRKRWYPLWDKVKHLVDYHIQGIEHNSLLGSIERTGKNMPIQGGSADMTKLALVLIRRHITDNRLRAIVKLVMQVHDQVTTTSKRHYAETWAPILTKLMEQAAKVIIPSGLLKAETNVTERWSK